MQERGEFFMLCLLSNWRKEKKGKDKKGKKKKRKENDFHSLIYLIFSNKEERRWIRL